MAGTMQRNGNGRPRVKRWVVSFEPCGPVASMIENETRGKGWGSQSRLMEAAIVKLLGRKYPKLRSRFEMLQQEAKAA